MEVETVLLMDYLLSPALILKLITVSLWFVWVHLIFTIFKLQVPSSKFLRRWSIPQRI